MSRLRSCLGLAGVLSGYRGRLKGLELALELYVLLRVGRGVDDEFVVSASHAVPAHASRSVFSRRTGVVAA
ncbi:hypothetical protein KEG38_20310 [Polyangium jinanense]|uniref:hypothetical protein n=1 Tax=Polyangium jinanense TaxID=2829994 RepID=UPI00234289A5|nr:hypothetical protein [Polyangium jinanense]MDC3956216.1 hypothetical protein [Polyangium jinanense]